MKNYLLAFALVLLGCNAICAEDTVSVLVRRTYSVYHVKDGKKTLKGFIKTGSLTQALRIGCHRFGSPEGGEIEVKQTTAKVN